MEKIALSVKCSFHFTTFTHASEEKASSLSSCMSIVFLTNLNYPYTPTLSMIQLILTLTVTPKPILTKSNLNNNGPILWRHKYFTPIRHNLTQETNRSYCVDGLK